MTAALRIGIVDTLSANRLVGAGAAIRVSVVRRDVSRELERQVQRALWRAERRGRGFPLAVRQSAAWVHAQRRKIAHELTRALASLGAAPALTKAIATQACERFPRDGVIITDADSRKPRERGDAPRQRATNPRARGESPRQRGVSPRQRRAAANLGDSLSPVATPSAIAPRSEPMAPVKATPSAIDARPIEELAPGWNDVKAQLVRDLTPDERLRARKAARGERERIEALQRSRSSPPTTH
jgi:hypothetical protein